MTNEEMKESETKQIVEAILVLIQGMEHLRDYSWSNNPLAIHYNNLLEIKEKYNRIESIEKRKE